MTVKDTVKNSSFVVPAKAGTQVRQPSLDARLREHDGYSEHC
jgi:hypothetical protein